MSNEELSTNTDKPSKISGAWNWIWPTIVGAIIVKLFGLLGGLVTIGAYVLLRPKLGVGFAVAVSGGIGVVAAVLFATAVGGFYPGTSTATSAATSAAPGSSERAWCPDINDYCKSNSHKDDKADLGKSKLVWCPDKDTFCVQTHVPR